MTNPTRFTSQSSARPWHRQLAADTAYVATGFPLALVSFSVLVSLIATGASLLITLVGLPILVLTWWCARLFALAERHRIARLDRAVPASPPYVRPRRGIIGMVDILRDRQALRDVAHGLLSLPVTCLTWSVAVAWWGTALFALPWPLFGHQLDGSNDRHTRDLPELLGIHSYGGRSLVYVLVGGFCLITLPYVLRGLAVLQSGFGRALLAPRQPVRVPPTAVHEVIATSESSARV